MPPIFALLAWPFGQDELYHQFASNFVTIQPYRKLLAGRPMPTTIAKRSDRVYPSRKGIYLNRCVISMVQTLVYNSAALPAKVRSIQTRSNKLWLTRVVK